MVITTMKEYEGKSLEELRLEDYLANRRGPAPGSTAAPAGGLFGTTNTAAKPGGLFGTTTPAAPAQTFLFGTTPSQPATATTGFNFGSTPASTGGGLFSTPATTTAAAPFSFGAVTQAKPTLSIPTTSATSTSQPQTTGLFGAKPAATTAPFGTAPASTFGTPFGSQPAAVRFIPPSSRKKGTKHMVITGMKEYKWVSLEELRLEDYKANRRGLAPGSTAAPVAGLFMTGVQPGVFFCVPGSSPSLFGQTAAPAAGNEVHTNLHFGRAFGQSSQGVPCVNDSALKVKWPSSTGTGREGVLSATDKNKHMFMAVTKGHRRNSFEERQLKVCMRNRRVTRSKSAPPRELFATDLTTDVPSNKFLSRVKQANNREQNQNVKEKLITAAVQLNSSDPMTTAYRGLMGAMVVSIRNLENLQTAMVKRLDGLEGKMADLKDQMEELGRQMPTETA